MSKRPLLPPPEREEMPIYDESIFYPAIERRIFAILKLRMDKLIHQKKLEFARELEALQKFSE